MVAPKGKRHSGRNKGGGATFGRSVEECPSVRLIRLYVTSFCVTQCLQLVDKSELITSADFCNHSMCRSKAVESSGKRGMRAYSASPAVVSSKREVASCARGCIRSHVDANNSLYIKQSVAVGMHVMLRFTNLVWRSV